MEDEKKSYIEVPPKGQRQYERLQLSALRSILTAKAAEQIYIDVERHGDGYVIDQNIAGLLGDIDGTIKDSVTPGPYDGVVSSTTLTVTDGGAGGANTVSWNIGTNQKVALLNAHAKCNNGADMTDFRFKINGTQDVWVTPDAGLTLKNNVAMPIYPIYYDGTSFIQLGAYPLVLTDTEYLTFHVTLAASKKLDIFLAYLKVEG